MSEAGWNYLNIQSFGFAIRMHGKRADKEYNSYGKHGSSGTSYFNAMKVHFCALKQPHFDKMCTVRTEIKLNTS